MSLRTNQGEMHLVSSISIQHFLNIQICLLILIHSKHMDEQKVLTKKGETIMFNGSKCDRKSEFSGIRTEPLNPREVPGVVHPFTRAGY